MSDHLPDLQEKVRTYLSNGAKIAVLIDPNELTVEVYRPSWEPEIHRNPATVVLDPELSGFALDLRVIFEE